MSRKADADTQAPLCGPGPKRETHYYTIYVGCHTLYDEHRSVFNQAFSDFDPEKNRTCNLMIKSHLCDLSAHESSMEYNDTRGFSDAPSVEGPEIP